MIDLDQVFCDIDDFNAEFEPLWKEQLLQRGEVKRCKDSSLSLSEVMTIIIAFHSSNFRTFKHFYTGYVLKQLRGAFPRLVSFNRMVELMPSALIPCVAIFTPVEGKSAASALSTRRPLSYATPNGPVLTSRLRS